MIIDNIISRAKMLQKTIVLPESMDERVVDAGIQAHKEGIAKIIFIGVREQIVNTFSNKDFLDIEFIDPKNFSDIEQYIDELYDMRKSKGMDLDEARMLLFNDYMYFACMLLLHGKADGVVSGAVHSTGEVLKPALQIIKAREDAKCVSAFFLMEVPNCEYGENGVFVFADSGLIQDPSVDELASIAASSAKSFESLVNSQAKVAFLSHSTYGSAKHSLVDKVREAVVITKREYPHLLCDGELQLDAAIDSSVAQKKAPDSNVAGQANVLIFPNLDAGNIGYKLVQRLARANAYGPITQGLRMPVNDLSRGASTDDILGVIAITVVQCDKN